MAEFAATFNDLDSLWQLIGVAVALQAVVAGMCVVCGKKDRLGALLVAFFFIELAGTFIFLTGGIEEMEGAESSSRLVPYLWAWPLLAAALWQFVRTWMRRDVKHVSCGRLDKVFAVIAVLFATVRCFNSLGFFASTGAMLVLVMLILGERRWKLMLSTAIVWMLFTWLVFNKLLLLGLPTGTLFA